MAQRQRPFITVIEEKENKKYMKKRRIDLLQLFQQYRDVCNG